MFQLQGYHTPQPPWLGLFGGTGEEDPSDSRISDSGGAVWFSSWSWNSGPALYPRQDPGGCMGVRPTGLHVFGGLGESIRLCPSGSPVVGAPGVWSAGPLDRGCSVSV